MKSEPSSFYFLKKPDRPPVQIKKTSNTSETKLSVPLSLIQYNNPFDEIEYLSTSIRARGHIPIVWSKARGLMVNHLSRAYPLFDGFNVAGLNDPLEVIKFIISKPQECISYIFEDFHHYIGEKDTINPVVGEIRSLIKELYRNLTGRNESVFLFVPRSYELPPELQPFFAQSIPKSLKKTKGYLDRYGMLLTDAEFLSHTKPMIGADTLIERLLQVLSQMETNNPLLVGPPGVGKTAVVEGLARMIYSGKVHPSLHGKALYSLSLNSLIAGTRYRGDLEDRLECLMEEVLHKKDKVIIFIDEIHTLIEAGATEGGMGPADILKPVLARGEFPCIGATTPAGAECFAKDPALMRRFKKIMVHEPSVDQSLAILRGIITCFENHHRLQVDDDALATAVMMSNKHIVGEYLPGKAISLVDGAAALCSMQGKNRVTSKDILVEMERLLMA
jgi:ATP-dependent Clp protease ATP-binding subunit ClpA